MKARVIGPLSATKVGDQDMEFVAPGFALTIWGVTCEQISLSLLLAFK